MTGLIGKMKSVSGELPTPLLPPGLVNQTNTCFFNSTLQALIATSLLEYIIHGRQLPTSEQPLPLPGQIAPERSLAMESRRNPTEFQDSVARMPLCMEFISFLEAAYERRDTRSNFPLSPRDLLQILGTKHGQYLDFRQQDAHELLRQLLDAMDMEEKDFRQQDAHELLRQLLDAMDMEEKDEIKRQSQAGRHGAHPSKDPAHHTSNQTQFHSFVETVFGGELTSFILCEGCRQLSSTDETFMDLSLSLKPDEKARKRDFLVQFVQKFVKVPSKATRPSPTGSNSLSPKEGRNLLAPTPLPAIHVHHVETPRSQSVPPGSPFVGDLHPHDVTDDPKRRSIEFANIESEESQLSSRSSTHSLFQGIPSDGPVSPGPEPLRGRDLLRTSLRPTSADSTATPVEDVGDSSRLSENKDSAEDWARHTSRDRMEAFIEAVFKTALPADRHKKPTSSSSNSSLDPTLLSSGFIRWSSSGSDIVDGLRRFTSVDILEGENAFACKRCWEESQRKKHHFVQGSDKVGRPVADSDGGSEVSASMVASDSPKESPATPSLDSSRLAKQLYQENLDPVSKKTDEGDLGRRGLSTAMNEESTRSGTSNDQRTAPDIESGQAASESAQTVRTRALKRYLIADPPAILVIHLKRFQQITKSNMAIFGNLRKIDDYVDYPEVLDMTEFIAPRKADYGLRNANENHHHSPQEPSRRRVLYRLYAVVVHLGNMLGGHYIAYAAAPGQPSTPDKRAATQDVRSWYFVSDTSVRQCSREEAMRGKAYICFYQRI